MNSESCTQDAKSTSSKETPEPSIASSSKKTPEPSIAFSSKETPEPSLKPKSSTLCFSFVRRVVDGKTVEKSCGYKCEDDNWFTLKADGKWESSTKNQALEGMNRPSLPSPKPEDVKKSAKEQKSEDIKSVESEEQKSEDIKLVESEKRKSEELKSQKSKHCSCPCSFDSSSSSDLLTLMLLSNMLQPRRPPSLFEMLLW